MMNLLYNGDYELRFAHARDHTHHMGHSTDRDTHLF